MLKSCHAAFRRQNVRLPTRPAAPPFAAVPHPQLPYTVNNAARVTVPHGANSLFEDNAEFGLGMNLAVQKAIETLENLIGELHDSSTKSEAARLVGQTLGLNTLDDGKSERNTATQDS